MPKYQSLMCIIGLGVLVYIFIRAALIWQFNVPAYSGCVILPNGLVIAYEGYVRPAFFRRSRIVVKTSDGQVLTRGDSARFVFSETTAIWERYDKSDTLPNPIPTESYVDKLAYRADVGFVVRKNNPELYDTLIKNAGPVLVKRLDIYGSEIALWKRMWELKRHLEYGSTDCDVPVIAPILPRLWRYD